MIDLDKDIELYKSKVAFYESQNTRGEYAVTVRELKFVVETLEALRAERSQGDLISRSALKEQVKNEVCEVCFTSPDDRQCSPNCKLCTFNQLIDNAPTVEPERPQGEWIPMSTDSRGYSESFKCSICGAYIYPRCLEKELDYNCCPYCGADMGGKEE